MPGLNYDENDDGTGQIDSRHLPVEPRTKVDTVYQNQPQQVQRVAAIAYSPGTVAKLNGNPSGDGGAQTDDDDEYLDAIRNAELVKNAQTSKAPYQTYAAGSQTAAIDHPQNYADSTKSPFSGTNEFKRYSIRAHTPVTPSPATSQQYSRQPTHHYTAQPTKHLVTAAAAGPSPDYSQTYDNKETIRVNLKKYQDSTGKTKYEPARGQYHHEVSAKSTKKVENFRPSYRFESAPQVRLDSSNQQSVVQLQQSVVQAQQQPLHYQSVQQISSADPKSGQSQYSIVVPRPTQQAQHAQQAYFSSEPSNPFQSFYPQHEQLIGGNFPQTSPESVPQFSTAAQPLDNGKPTPQSEFRIQYLHHVSPTPTPTPTPRARFAPDSTPGQPLKYELYDPNGSVNVLKEPPKFTKLISAGGLQQQQPPQHLHRPQFADTPQYFKKLNRPPTAHVQYVPIRQQQQYQLNAPSPQPPLSPQASQHYRQATAAGQGQSDILVSIQPSQNTLFVSPNTGNSSWTLSDQPVAKIALFLLHFSGLGEASVSPSGPPPQQHVQLQGGHQEQRRPPLPITSPKKPITQAEFQALVDAGYKVQAIPVPVPVPVSSEKYKQLQYQSAQRGIGQPGVHNINGGGGGGNGGPLHHAGSPHTRQASTHYIRYHPKPQESDEGILTSYLKPLIDYIGGPAN